MSECVLCQEYVTNPVCSECLGKGVGQWLQENFPEKVVDFKALTKNIPKGTYEDDRCIKCQKKMSVCTYCYTEEIFTWLVANKTHKDILKQYMKFFNFDLGHKGYRTIAETLQVTA